MFWNRLRTLSLLNGLNAISFIYIKTKIKFRFDFCSHWNFYLNFCIWIVFEYQLDHESLTSSVIEDLIKIKF